MEHVLAVLIGLFLAGGVYLLLSRSLLRMLLGLTLFGNAINLTIFTAGRLVAAVPPIVTADALVPPAGSANPLPQALILTAIVIGFSMFAFLLILAYRAYAGLAADDTDKLRLAEPKGGPHPPLSY
jgi:multicomponent Na+:H+ antiporter subunit C